MEDAIEFVMRPGKHGSDTVPERWHARSESAALIHQFALIYNHSQCSDMGDDTSNEEEGVLR
jgi:hypothetical protein